MVRTKALSSLAAVLVLATSLLAREGDQIKELRQQIKMLTNERDAALKSMHKQYESLIRQDKRSEKEMAAMREWLKKQEKASMSGATTEQERQAIKQRFDFLRRALTQDIKLDARQIAELRASEKGHVQSMRAAYDAKIKEMQAAIKQLETPIRKTKR
jgi:hypothetical protein